MLLARCCPGCGVATAAICGRCLSAITTNRPSEHQLRGAVSSLGLDGLEAVGVYGPVTRRVLVAAKNRSRADVYRTLAPLLHSRLSVQPEAITWVPASRHRRRKRGFDHGRVLSVQVGRLLGVRPEELLIRADRVRSIRRSREQRLAGPRLSPRRASPRTVLLVDDVLTTGGSLRAAAVALRRAGAERVVAGVLAVVDDGG